MTTSPHRLAGQAMSGTFKPENHAAWLDPDHQTMRREASAHAGLVP
jgi:hypothetical protein